MTAVEVVHFFFRVWLELWKLLLATVFPASPRSSDSQHIFALASTVALGAALFGAMSFIAGAAPGLIPMVYVVFFVYMMPARTVYFIQRKWTFFLIDFCYVSAGLFL